MRSPPSWPRPEPLTSLQTGPEGLSPSGSHLPAKPGLCPSTQHSSVHVRLPSMDSWEPLAPHSSEGISPCRQLRAAGNTASGNPSLEAQVSLCVRAPGGPCTHNSSRPHSASLGGLTRTGSVRGEWPHPARFRDPVPGNPGAWPVAPCWGGETLPTLSPNWRFELATG